MTAITEQADGFKRSTKHPVWSPQQRLWRLLPGCGNWVLSTSKAYLRLKTGNTKPDARPSKYKSRAHCPPSSPQSPFWGSQVHLGCWNSTLCAQQNPETLNPHADGGSSKVRMVTTGPGVHWGRGHKSTPSKQPSYQVRAPCLKSFLSFAENVIICCVFFLLILVTLLHASYIFFLPGWIHYTLNLVPYESLKEFSRVIWTLWFPDDSWL